MEQQRQQAPLDNVLTNLNEADDHAHKAGEELKKANEKLKKRNKRMCLLALCLFLVVALVVCAFAGVFSGSSSSTVKVYQPPSAKPTPAPATSTKTVASSASTKEATSTLEMDEMVELDASIQAVRSYYKVMLLKRLLIG